jgi:DNA-binding beta-propeller fold protein YncE
VNNGGFLYIVEADDDEISKIDLTIPDPTPVSIVNGLWRPNFVISVGNFLYFTEFFGNRISKIDITQPNPVPVIVVEGLNTPEDLLLIGNDLFDAGKICKIDITQPNPVPVTVISGLGWPTGIEINGNDLYISENSAQRISKIDISISNPVIINVIGGLNGPLGGMKINGNDLYFFQYDRSEISKIDISSPTPVVTNIDIGVSGADLEFVGNDMYVSDFENGLILKYPDQLILNITTFSNSNFQIYPNPTSDFISFRGLPLSTKCIIFNTLGNRLMEVVISDYSKLDIRSLKTGSYFIVSENRWTKTFIIK